MKSFSKLSVLLVMIGAFLVGCSSAPKEEQTAAGVDSAGSSTSGSDMTSGGGVDTTGASGGSGFDSSALDDPNSILSKRIIYFDYDSAVVKDEYTAIVEAHAQFLAQNPNARVTLEGHADERGSREYNLGLGERRALAVAQFMQLLNVNSAQVQSVSYGEERPLSEGHDDSAWSQNRRVELVYER